MDSASTIGQGLEVKHHFRAAVIAKMSDLTEWLLARHEAELNSRYKMGHLASTPSSIPAAFTRNVSAVHSLDSRHSRPMNLEESMRQRQSQVSHRSTHVEFFSDKPLIGPAPFPGSDNLLDTMGHKPTLVDSSEESKSAYKKSKVVYLTEDPDSQEMIRHASNKSGGGTQK